MRATALDFVQVSDAPTRAAARTLITEYLNWVAAVAADEYGLSFDIQAMVNSDLDDPTKFYPPAGRFYILRHAGANVGIGCLKALGSSVAEIQRMYVQPRVRGIGAGRQLLDRLLVEARTIGYASVRLESLKALHAAHALYRSVGFVEIAPYGDNSMKDYQTEDKLQTYRSSAVFMELRLAA
jgi:GNAT superfamily N-acetyltransferase